MTNADCIRRMSDDQLYDFLSEWECGDIDYSITFCDLCKQGGNELNLDCDGCRRHWLQRDATDYGGLMYWKKNTTFETEPQLVKESVEVVKDEPQISPPDPFDCATCKHNPWSTPRTCGKCVRQDGKTSMYEPQTEREVE